MRKYPEDDLQMACARYLDYLPGVRWTHVANERKTTDPAGYRLKKKGVKSGVPDILIFNPKGPYSGLAVELKIKPNKPTTNQKEWLDSLKNLGWSIAVCYDFEEFHDLVNEYLALRHLR